jgi:hypothetical protein
MQLTISDQALAMVRLPAGSPPPDWATGPPITCITVTPEETSVICPTAALPDDLPGPVEGPMVGARITEPVEFSQVGVMVSLLRPLADAGITVLTVSTYDTDWVLVPSDQAAAAAAVWRHAGHEVTEAGR